MSGAKRKQLLWIAVVAVLAALAGCGAWLHWRYTHATVTVVNATSQELSYITVTFQSGQFVETHTILELPPGTEGSVHFAPPDSGTVTLSYTCGGGRVSPDVEKAIGPRGERVWFTIRSPGGVESDR